MKEIDRKSKLSPEEFRAYYLKNEIPVVISNGIESWRAISTWDESYFKDRFGDVRVRVAYRGEDYSEKAATQKLGIDLTNIRMKRFIELIESQECGGLWYLYQTSLSGFRNEILDDLGTLPYFSEKFRRVTGQKPNIWIGPGNIRSGLHFDRMNNFVAQIKGRKKWTIFPRNQQPFLYFPTVNNLYAVGSPINIALPDYDAFPDFRKATPLTAILEKGDLLFVPAGWAHDVESLDFAIMLNYWVSWFTWKDVKRVAPQIPKFITSKIKRVLNR